jgi:hypothetical protein
MITESIVLSPMPEFVTSVTKDWAVYGWKVDCGDILAFGDTKNEALANWAKSYSAEYGINPIMQIDMFAA